MGRPTARPTGKPESKVRAGSIITAVSFLAVIFGFAVAGAISPDRERSEMENRPLMQIPEFSLKSLKDGKFTSDIETYMSDQVFLKDQLVTLKTAADRLLMKTYQNGVYFGSDGYYLQDYQENRALVEKNISCINDFADSVSGKADISFLLVPNAVSVLSDKLPEVTQTDDQLDTSKFIKESLSDSITLCCPFEELKNAAENETQVFYRTDHHWTSEGAQIGFESLMTSMGESVPEYSFQTEKLSDFYGTLYSKAPDASAKADEIHLYSDPENSVTVNYVSCGGDHDTPPAEWKKPDGAYVGDSLFARDPKTQKDKYAVFLGGNFSLIEIETQGESDENVLIIKDSYANAAMPYFCRKYKHISMIDLRYYHMEELSVSEYVSQNDIDRVIFLYDIDFVNSDNNFVWLD